MEWKYFKDYFYKIVILILLLMLIFIALKNFHILNNIRNLRELSISYFIPIILLIIIMYSLLKSSNEIKLTGIITLFLLSFLFIFFEIFLTFKYLDKNSLIKQSAKKNGYQYDERNLLEIVNDNKKKGIDVVPFFKIPIFKEIIPVSFIANQITIGSKESGKYYYYKTDRFGFNNKDGSWDNKDQDIVFIGDSFTRGTQPDQDNFFDMFNNSVKILNLGTGGNGPLKNLVTLIEYGKKANSKKIFWLHYSGNDFKDLNTELESNTLSKYAKVNGYSQNLVKNVELTNTLLINYYETNFHNFTKKYKQKNKWAIFLQNLSKIIKLTQIRQSLSLIRVNNNIEVENFAEFKNIILKADNFSREIKSKLIILNIPSAYDLQINNRDSYLSTSKKMEELMKAHKIPYYDFADFIDIGSYEKNFSFEKKGGHLSKKGNLELFKLIKDINNNSI